MMRSRSVSTVLACGLVLVLVAGASSVALAAPGWVTINLTPGSGNGERPFISGARVAWDEILLFGTAGPQPAVCTVKLPALGVVSLAGPYSEVQGVSGDRVVWKYSPGGPAWAGDPFQIYTRKIGVEAVPIQLTASAQEQEDARVSGDRVVWRGYDGAHWQIYTRKIAVGEILEQLTSDANDHDNPQVSGDRVVWQAYDGARWQIYTQTFGPGASQTQITNDANDQQDPQVSGDRIVWRGYDGAHWQIFTQQVAPAAPIIPLTSDAQNHRNPQISGARAVWEGSDGAHWQVFTRKLDGAGAAVGLTSDARDHAATTISGDRVAWEGHVGANWQIFTRKVGVTGTVQLTADAYDHHFPQVSGERVVWERDVPSADGDRNDVYQADTIRAVSIVRTPSSNAIVAVRNHGIARFTLTGFVRNADKLPVAGVRMCLQKSANGRTGWTNSWVFTTNVHGAAAKAFATGKSGTSYYRWYVPAGVGYVQAYAARQRVDVR